MLDETTDHLLHEVTVMIGHAPAHNHAHKSVLQVVMRRKDDAPAWISRLKSDFDVDIGVIAQLKVHPSACVIFDLDDYSSMSELSAWRTANDAEVGALVYVGPQTLRAHLLRNGLLRDANFLAKPLDGDALQDLLGGLRGMRVGAADPPASRRRLYDANPPQAAALQAGDDVLDEIFGMFGTRQQIDAREVWKRSTVVVDALEETGLQGWVTAVREHHNSTYQHCLLVTGVLVGLGQALGMRTQDLRRLASGGLLHDIGKAAVPLNILDKPTPLTEAEIRIMQRHPGIGASRLSQGQGASDDMIRLVRDHHEYLDGSGYPNGIMEANIPDPVRLMTIADVYSALIEKRTYKASLSSEDAVTILDSMQGRIDMPLLRACTPVLKKIAF
jgi:putative nucleotidyltransferase with HDIG domain